MYDKAKKPRALFDFYDLNGVSKKVILDIHRVIPNYHANHFFKQWSENPQNECVVGQEIKNGLPKWLVDSKLTHLQILKQDRGKYTGKCNTYLTKDEELLLVGSIFCLPPVDTQLMRWKS